MEAKPPNLSLVSTHTATTSDLASLQRQQSRQKDGNTVKATAEIHQHSRASPSTASFPQVPTPDNKLAASTIAHTAKTPKLTSHRPNRSSQKSKKRSLDMAEPPAKRAKRTDSAAMWERNSKPSTTGDKPQEPSRNGRMRDERNGDRKDDRNRQNGRGNQNRRSRSRSRERVRDRDRDKRRVSSRSRERDGKRHMNGDRSRSRDRDGRRRRDGERRERERSASKERHRSRRDDPPSRRPDRRRTRSRSRSPTRNTKSSIRTRSPPRGASSKPPPTGPSKQSRASLSPPPTKAPPTGPVTASPLPKTNGAPSSSSKPQAPDLSTASKMDIDEDSDPETAQMRQMMGFANFKTTKNKKVPGNDVWAVRKEKKTEYRQYMNRVGGFNRPLSPSR
ncbi:MAG: hypothetical protein Q9170_005008 [Blastenia crenularia]